MTQTQTLDMTVMSILVAAASSSHGLVLRTNNPIAARAALYETRKKLSDPELDCLQMRVSPDDSEHEVWIVKRTQTVSVVLSSPEAALA